MSRFSSLGAATLGEKARKVTAEGFKVDDDEDDGKEAWEEKVTSLHVRSMARESCMCAGGTSCRLPHEMLLKITKPFQPFLCAQPHALQSLMLAG
jgi:hypothetical protein